MIALMTTTTDKKITKMAFTKSKLVLFIGALLVAYAPMKDALDWSTSFFDQTSISLVDISFGTNFPWQRDQKNGYIKVSNNSQQPLLGPQIIYTRFKLSNPTNQSVSFKKIWLTFEHKNGKTEYTTDYNLYDSYTRQKLIGSTVNLAPNSEVELLASYRFIPSYSNSHPESIQVSWEGHNALRESSCELLFSSLLQNNFGHLCNK